MQLKLIFVHERLESYLLSVAKKKHMEYNFYKFEVLFKFRAS